MVHRIRRRVLRRRFLVTTLTLAALAAILLGAGQVSAASPFGKGHRGDCARALAGGFRLNNTLEELVAEGTITADQQEAIVDALGEPRACTRLGGLRVGVVSDAVTDLLGLERSDIRQAWLDGASLTEIAAEQGVDRDALLEAMISAVDARLTEAVDEGTITAEQKADMLTRATEAFERGVDLHRGDLRAERDAAGSDESATPAQ